MPVQHLPSTILPTRMDKLDVMNCSREELQQHLIQDRNSESVSTILEVLRLVCDLAAGGAFVVVAPRASYERTFADTSVVRTSDQGYMTNRMKGIHVSDPEFDKAFVEFTEHSCTDRWPINHPDPAARGQPKDG